MTEDLQWQLEKDGYAVAPGDLLDWVAVYRQAEAEGYTPLITTDLAFHTAALAYAALLDGLESLPLSSDLLTFADQLEKELSGPASDPALLAQKPLAEALRRSWAYAGVLKKLLHPEWELPEEIRSLAEAELTLISESKGLAKSPLLGNTMNYARFRPPGRYNTSPERRRYYQGITWLRTATFRLEERDEILYALPLLATLYRSSRAEKGSINSLLYATWSRLYGVHQYLYARQEAISPHGYLTAYRIVFQDDSLLSLADARLRQRFIDRVKADYDIALKEKKVFLGDGWFRKNLSLRLLPDEPAYDSPVYREVLYPFVGGRTLPEPMEIMVTLGSRSAYHIVSGSLMAYEASYVEHINRAIGAPVPNSLASLNYYGWLVACYHTFARKAEQAPFPFKVMNVYDNKALLTAMGAWADFHWAVDVGRFQPLEKPPSQAPGEGQGPAVLVEPLPQVFATLKLIDDNLINFITNYGGTVRAADFLVAHSTAMAAFERAAGEALASPDRLPSPQTAQEAGSALKNLLAFFPDQGAASLETQPTTVFEDWPKKRVLQVSTGRPLLILAQTGAKGAESGFRPLAAGVIYTYYEATSPLERPLNEEEWRQRLQKEELEMPWWAERVVTAD
ncbi:MAG: DUF3160 domain-containing protein [Bacillota bacterium]|nr:DUF3160 domain-containing protein [Bacillota bacterium]